MSKTKNNRWRQRRRYYQPDYIVDPDDYHNRFDLVSKKRFLANPKLHRGWGISKEEIAEAKAWLRGWEELQAAYAAPRAPLGEQRRMLREMGIGLMYAGESPFMRAPGTATALLPGSPAPPG